MAINIAPKSLDTELSELMVSPHSWVPQKEETAVFQAIS